MSAFKFDGMSESERELAAEFIERPLVNYEEGDHEGRTRLTLTPWEIRVVVRRVMVWHRKRIKQIEEQS